SQAPGDGAPQLALPARPPHRRLRRDHAPPARRMTRARARGVRPPATRAPDPPPAALGFRMPAEWEPHEATWIAWPHEERDWPGRRAPIDGVYGEFVRHIAVGERVRILVHNATVEKRARALLKRVGVDRKRVDFFRAPTDRSWTRDYCPIYVT